MKEPNKRKIGKIGEKAAAKFLKKAGYRILSKNKHEGKNELDIVAKNKECICFVEVKTRTFAGENSTENRPSAAVDIGKRQRTAKAAFDFLKEHPSPLCPRLDVIEVYLDRQNKYKPFKIHHIPNAFSAKGATRT